MNANNSSGSSHWCKAIVEEAVPKTTPSEILAPKLMNTLGQPSNSSYGTVPISPATYPPSNLPYQNFPSSNAHQSYYQEYYRQYYQSFGYVKKFFFVFLF